MSSVVQLVPRAADRPSSSDQLLFPTISILVALTTHTITLERRVSEQAARIAELDARLAPPRFEVPKDWITIKRASGLCGNAPPTLYRWVRIGRIVGAPYGGRIYVDPTSLPKRSEII
jgi:hypothetical protein